MTRILLLSTASFAQDLLQFKNYLVPIYQSKNQPLKLDQRSRKYRTLLQELSTQKPNFAGHYVMDIFGCGGG